MVNSSQQALLDSFIAEEGIFITTIERDEVFNLGTKILYLERAISQNCQEFLQSLDKLYSPDLTGKAKIANIEFIRALKLINDFCFNNEVKYAQYGTRPSLNHFFGSLGGVDPLDFQTTVQSIINARIAALRDGHTEEVTLEKTLRKTAEADIARQTEWRAELDLPLAQQVHHFQPIHVQQAGINVIQQLNGALTAEEYTQISTEVRQLVARYAYNFARLISEAHIPLADLLALEQGVCRELLNMSHGVAQLISEVHIPLADLLALEQGVRRELLNMSGQVARLISEAHIPLADLLALDQGVRRELLNMSGQVARLISDGHIDFEKLSGLSITQLRIVIANPNSEAS